MFNIMNAPHRKQDEKTGHEPPQGVPVWVRCDGYRCLAVKDRNGQWRVFFNNEPLAGEVQVINDQMSLKKR
jgi:hypothetical protein